MHDPVDILLVEDNPGDILLTKKALEAARVANILHVVTDGASALDFLHKKGDYPEVPEPGLILLDLNLPKKDGRAVLAELKADPRLRKIPVIVLSTSSNEDDIDAAYRDHANSYVVKPMNGVSFLAAIRKIEEYWLALVRLPGA